MTGCLQPGDAPNTFRLAAVGGPNGAVGTTGKNNQTSQKDNPTGNLAKSNSSDIGAATTRDYTLVAGREVDLATHQGTVVQVTGRVDQQQNGVVPSGSGTNNSNASTAPLDNHSRAEVGHAQAGKGANSQAAGQGANASTGQAGNGQSRGETANNPTTGTGTQEFAQGQAPNRGAGVLHVEAVKRVAGTCGEAR